MDQTLAPAWTAGVIKETVGERVYEEIVAAGEQVQVFPPNLDERDPETGDLIELLAGRAG
jgi:hypothetical protein